ncbi:hypothetical protein LOC67_19485 [Stieleria sp. JC731]|uniref:hypothetical protein n=1 Tax=Pirellulaceae TaxID=2691357 RepID=UPI001E42C131|nr:hypothetical protein [Stieleria sp. JC731]MCC9602738.1 hypothetical protein [Stieleria sp. JC731]
MNSIHGRVNRRVARQWIAGGFSLLTFLLGCHVSTPQGNVIEPRTLGSQLDEINQRQEDNAELAKFIVYMHEFEINLQEDPARRAANEKAASLFDYIGEIRPHGLRLTPDGEDHVRQIAHLVQADPTTEIRPQVIVERSVTSKQWDTEHYYPVHYNEELDELRRRVVVKVLQAYGIEFADQIVVVAPAFPTGLEATEAAAAFENSVNSYRGNSRNFGSRN